MKPKPIVGQKLYSLNVGNAVSRFDKKQFLTKVEVIKVGRKYFTCKVVDGWEVIEYHLDNWKQKSDYAATSVLYEFQEEYEKEKEVNEKYAELKEYFLGYVRKLPDDVILKMHECLKGVK